MSVSFIGSIPNPKCMIVHKTLSGEIKHNMILYSPGNCSEGTRIRKTSSNDNNTYEVSIAI
jgi:hypothetical protein